MEKPKRSWSWLRWIAVLPATCVAMLIVFVLLCEILFNILPISGYGTEILIYWLVASAVSVWVGANIAPSYKIVTSIVLCILFICIYATALLFSGVGLILGIGLGIGGFGQGII